MDQLNNHLAVILDQATEIQESRTERPDAHAALRNAVMNYVEQDLRLPVLVKYGDAEAVRKEYGTSNNRVWGAVPNGNYSLFYVEPEGDITDEQWSTLHEVFAAIGAWHIGTTGVSTHSAWTHALYAWPNDHPVLDLLPVPP